MQKQGTRYALKCEKVVVGVVKNVQYGAFPNNQLDLYFPEDAGFATIVYFHGG